MKCLWRVLTLSLGLLVGLAQAAAVDVYPFKTPEEEARFHLLVSELRCPKCQNQNLADSEAPIAKDLKDKVYQKIQQGNSDQQILDYLVARYGDFISYRPPFKLSTLWLWLSPWLVLIMGVLIILVRLKRRRVSLSAEQQQRLQQLVREHQQEPKQ